MKYNKLKYFTFLLGFIFLSTLSSVHAVTYLNNCQDVVWTTGETYIINFSHVSVGSTCFQSDTEPGEGIIKDIHFEMSPNISEINIDVNNDFVFFNGFSSTYGTDAYKFIYNTTFDNININFNPNYVQKLFATQNSRGTIFRYNNISNVNITGATYFLDLNSAGGSCGTTNLLFYDNIINNSYIDSQYFTLPIPNSNCLGGSLNNKISNSLIITDYFLPELLTGGSSVYYLVDNNTISNSVIVSKSHSNIIGIGGDKNSALYLNYYYSSMISGYSFIDSNNDNIDDNTPDYLNETIGTSHGYFYSYNGNIYKDLFGYRWIQDANEGKSFTSENKTIVPINNDNLNTDDWNFASGSNTTLDTSYGNIFATQYRSINLQNSNSLDCLLNQETGCNIYSNMSVFAPSIKFRPVVGVNSNSKIRNQYIIVDYLGDSDSQAIANSVDITRNNIEITNNYISSENINEYSIETEESVTTLLKLKSNNLNISNNYFQANVLESGFGVNYAYIEGTNPVSNKIYNNTFGSSITTFQGDVNVFKFKCDAEFYNNYLGNNITIGDCTNVNATPLIGFTNDDGYTYYYYIGNYYADNTACVDSNSDGFCDSPYTSGSVTDTRPLSSYPFVFTDHLFTADLTVESSTFQVTIYSPINGQTVQIPNGASSINLSFSHNSDFPDLTCDYVIDGVPVDGATIVNTPKDTIESISVSGWEEREYSFSAECYNDQSFSYDESIFYVDFTTTPTSPTGNDTGISAGSLTVTDIITDDINESGNNVVEFLKLGLNFSGYGVVLGFIIIFISIIILIIGIFKYFAR